MADERLDKQKESIRLEKEYRQALSFSHQMQKDITAEISRGVDARTKMGKSLRQYNKDLMSGISKLQTSTDVANKMVELEYQNMDLIKSKNQYNKAEVDAKLASNKVAIEGLGLEYERLRAAEELDAKQESITSGINSQIDKIKEFGSNLPIIGGLFDSVFGGAFDTLKKDVSDAGKEMVTQFAAGGMSLKNMTAAMSSFGTSMLTALATNPMVLLGIAAAAAAAIIIGVGVLIGKAFKAGLDRFKELDSAAQTFRDTTGLLVSQTRGMQENIRAVNVEFANLGVSAEDVAKAAGEFVNEFDGLEQPSQKVLGSMVMLNKNFGVGTQEAAKLNKVFQNIGDLSAEQSQYLIGQTAEMAKMAGVAPQKVIKDMADSSEYAYKYFKGSPQELAKAAVQAAKMGTSIAEAGKAADNLLDFQNSITSELEASAMLGVNLNLSQARYAAANGDLIGQQQAINDQVAQLGDLTKLNVYEQEALAKATGMEFSSLVNQQRIRERFGALNKEQLAAATALVDSGKDINKITKEDLELQNQRMKSQQDMQSTMSAIQNETGALKTAFSDMMAPLAGFVMNNLLDGLKMIGMVLMPVMKAIGSIGRIIFGVLGAVFDVITSILSPIFAIGGAILDFILKPFSIAADLLQPLFDKFKELKSATMEAVQPILDIFRSLGNLMGEMVKNGPVGYFVDFLSWSLGNLISLIGFLGKAIGFILTPIMKVIGYLMEGISFVGQLINDYLIQPIKDAASLASSALSTLTFGLVGGGDDETTSSGDTSGGQTSSNSGGEIPMLAEGGIVQSPIQAIVGEAGPEAVIPLDQLASVIGSSGGEGGGRPSWVDEVVTAIRQNKDVYMDRVKVSAEVTNTQERSGRENRFGLQGA